MTSARDPWFDNAKITILALVVAGHVVEAWIAVSAPARVVYNAIYLFHMPAIILLAGAFAGQARPAAALRQAARFALLYLVFQVFFDSWYRLLAGSPALPNLAVPSFALWFLLAFAVWSLLAPLLARSGWWVVISLAIAIAVGYLPGIGPAWSLSRILVFLPFLALGAWLGPTRLSRLCQVRPLQALALLTVALAAFFATIPTGLGSILLLQRSGYDALGIAGPQAGLIRLWALLLGLAASIAVLALVPRGYIRLTDRGRRTLELYIFHSAVIMTARMLGLLPADPTPLALLTGLTLWTMSIWLFTRPAFARAVAPVMAVLRRRR